MEELPLRENIDAWRLAGVAVTLCLSRSVESRAALDGIYVGHVQNAAAKDLKAGAASAQRSAVLMCGAKRMLEEAQKELSELGVPEPHFLTNY